MSFTISQLAKIAGISVRTLHHYDQIGLFKPMARSAGGYRLYQQQQLLQLQQILMYRELELPLAEIQRLLQNPDYNLVSCLLAQKQQLTARLDHLTKLLAMLDQSLLQLESDTMSNPNHSALFQHFSPQVLREEAIQRWGATEIEQHEQQQQQLSASEQQAQAEQGELIASQLSQLRHLSAYAAEVQQLMQAQHQWLLSYGACPAERLLQLASLYVQDERFNNYYNRFGAGTAELMHDGLRLYAATLTGPEAD